MDFNDRSLQIYLKELKNIPVLTRSQEKELTERIKKGDKKALEQLIKGNLRFVVNIAKEYQGKGLSLSELINEGNYGLIVAAKKFDPDKNVRFISYAVWWIRQTIMKAILENANNIRIPLSQINKLNKIKKATREITDESGDLPTIKELTEKLNLSENEIKNTIKLNKTEISLNTPLSDSNNLYLGNTIEQSQFLSPEEVFFRKRYKEVLKSQLEKLSDREAYVLKMYFGLEDNRAHTLEEIGKTLNISRERVRQIKERAIDKLKNMTKGTLSPFKQNA